MGKGDPQKSMFFMNIILKDQFVIDRLALINQAENIKMLEYENDEEEKKIDEEIKTGHDIKDKYEEKLHEATFLGGNNPNEDDITAFELL